MVDAKQLKKQIYKRRQVYLMLLPIIVFYIIFCYVPMFGNIIAFQNYKVTRGILRSTFVGVKHFADFLQDYNFWRLLKNTLMINAYQLVMGFPAPIILALLLNEVKNIHFKKTVQTITYIPHFISMVVACSMICDFVSTNGLLNSVIVALGGKNIQFLAEPNYFYSIYTISGIWQSIGWNSIIYMSALSAIDQELYEAAGIDGAGRWKRIVHITIPGIIPTIMILLIMQIGMLLSVGYEKILLLYNPIIYEKADVISTYVYRRGILNVDYSYSAAVGLFNSIINFIFLIMANKLSKKGMGIGLF